jgi:hypothetical protein
MILTKLVVQKKCNVLVGRSGEFPQSLLKRKDISKIDLPSPN